MKRASFFSLLFLALCACSDAPPPAAKKEPEKPAEPVTGRYAFHQMYAAARAWSPDLQALRLTSIRLPQVKGEAGKSGAWEAVFVSPAKARAKSYTYSVVEAEGNLHKGVFAGQEESYSGPRGQAKPFLIAALKTDSDEAYKVAADKSAEYMKKNPNMNILFNLELTTRHPNPNWRVVWGDSIGTSNYSILVDASTGQYSETMR